MNCPKCGIGPMRETCAYPEDCGHPGKELALERNQLLLKLAERDQLYEQWKQQDRERARLEILELSRQHADDERRMERMEVLITASSIQLQVMFVRMECHDSGCNSYWTSNDDMTENFDPKLCDCQLGRVVKLFQEDKDANAHIS